MKVLVSVTNSSTVLVPPGNWKFIGIQVKAGEPDIYLDFSSGDGVALTTDTGIRLSALEPALLMTNGNPINLCKSGVRALSETTSAVVVQYE